MAGMTIPSVDVGSSSWLTYTLQSTTTGALAGIGNNTYDNSTLSEKEVLFWESYERIAQLYHIALGYVMVIMCLAGMAANILNMVALGMIVRRSKLPVYRCFLGLAVADFMVSAFYFYSPPERQRGSDIFTVMARLLG